MNCPTSPLLFRPFFFSVPLELNTGPQIHYSGVEKVLESLGTTLIVKVGVELSLNISLGLLRCLFSKIVCPPGLLSPSAKSRIFCPGGGEGLYGAKVKFPSLSILHFSLWKLFSKLTILKGKLENPVKIQASLYTGSNLSFLYREFRLHSILLTIYFRP